MKTELRRRGVVPNRFWPKQNGYNGPRVFTLTFAVHMFDSTKLALDVLDVPTGCRYWMYLLDGCTYWMDVPTGWMYLLDGCTYLMDVPTGWMYLLDGCTYWMDVPTG